MPPTPSEHGPRLHRIDARAWPRAFRNRRSRSWRVVAFRTALDHPSAVDRLAVLDAVPIGEVLARCDAGFARTLVALVLLRPNGQARRAGDLRRPRSRYGVTPEHMGAEAYADFQRAIHDPETVHAMMEDYRAGLGIDRRHDDRTTSGRRVTCPVLVLWATDDDLPTLLRRHPRRVGGMGARSARCADTRPAITWPKRLLMSWRSSCSASFRRPLRHGRRPGLRRSRSEPHLDLLVIATLLDLRVVPQRAFICCGHRRRVKRTRPEMARTHDVDLGSEQGELGTRWIQVRRAITAPKNPYVCSADVNL